jgi:hypothetical protein
MYINKIDDIIDKVIDDFYTTVILTDKILTSVFKEPNFVKYQQDLNTLMENYIKSINLSELQGLVKSGDAVNTIKETLKRYTAIYLFLTIGFHYSSRDDTYVNNVVEFSKNQTSYPYKVENYFNSEGNALTIKYFMLVKNILILLNADQAKIAILKLKPDFKETIVFLNNLGGDYVVKNFKLENIENNVKDQCHNILKTIIILELYRTHEKKEFFRLLEMTENMEGEYMFIDIVVPTKKHIDFGTIENLLSKKDVMKGMAYTLWDYLMASSDIVKKPTESIEDKLLTLINAGLLYPICDDFLLYHKESEKYDRVSDPNKIKKKEDTKIRYIVNKIDIASELNTEAIRKDEKLKANVKKQFYAPLYNRKAILVNHGEDIKIINKFLNQGKRSVENNEYFNDLQQYKSYPYINFKDFEKSGFSLQLTKTIDIVRSVSFSTTGDFKQNRHNYLQLRVGSKDMTVNVVGFMIPTNQKPLQCVKIKDTDDIRSFNSKNKNGYDLMTKYLKETLINTKPHNSSIYWMFDLDIDSVQAETYEQTTKFTTQDQIKTVASKIYDYVLYELYYELIDILEKNAVSLQGATRILKILEKRTVKIPRELEIYSELEKKIFNLIQVANDEYDKNEDIIYGLTDEAVKLAKPSIKKSQGIPTLVVKSVDAEKKEDNTNLESVEGVCQHNITWDRLSGMQRINPNKYLDELYEYIQQYVIENTDSEFICKSCGGLLNIKKFVMDGSWDDDTQRFITYSMPMDVPLEDIPEYEKYKLSIRNLDKIIEKIGSTSNIPNFVGTSTNVRSRRKGVIKDAIDILIMNNQKLKKTFKERNEMASSTYGVVRDLSNLFVFEFENGIFVFSSKDKDYYKPIKQNNVLAYLTILIILEVNESQALFMGTTDKKGLCNFNVFDKVFHTLFSGLKVRKNSKGELAPITNYKILCYFIYIMACSMSKYNMWFYEYPTDGTKTLSDATRKKHYMPIIQKIIVHTVVDVLNSILELAATPEIHHLYEVISIKFYKKLPSLFNSEELYQRFKADARTSMSNEKKDYITTKKEAIVLSGKMPVAQYDLPIRYPCRPPRYYVERNTKVKTRYNTLTNVTNCPSGKFHSWQYKDKTLVCTICNVSTSKSIMSETESKSIMKNFRYVRLQNLAQRFCAIDASLHQYITSDNGTLVCKKCSKSDKYEYNHQELDNIEKILDTYQSEKNTQIIKQIETILEKEKTDSTYETKVFDYLTKAYGQFKTKSRTDSESQNNNYQYINDLINEIQNVVGNEAGIGSETFLRENAYIINHDHLGYPLDKPVIITDNDNKISYKSNHTFFKTDVIYYSSYKNGKIDIFYDATTKILLGYKEESKNFIFNKKSDKRIVINYSIYNKFRLLGYQHQYIDVTDMYDELLVGREDISTVDFPLVTKIIVESLIRTRIQNLKKTITEFQSLIFRMLNNYAEPINENDDTDYFANKLNKLIDKHKKKLMSMTLADGNNNHQIFKHWKGVYRGILPKPMNKDDLTVDFTKYKLINAETVNQLDESGNLILYFIVTEIHKLLKYNTNKFTKADISYFIIDFINIVFDMFNEEKLINNIDIKRFIYMLKSSTYVGEVEEKSGLKSTEGIYNEFVDPDETEPEKTEIEEELREENDALDLDVEIDYINEYDKGIDWEPAGDIIVNPNAQY